MCLLQSLDLLQSPHVALLGEEARAEEGTHELGGQLGTYDLRPETEHVHVVVLDALVRGVGVVADCRANPGQLAGGDRRADARAADENAPFGISRADRRAQLLGLVGVVDPDARVVRAEVYYLVAERLDRGDHRAPQFRSPMIEGHCDTHASTLPLWRFVDSSP